MKTCLSSNIVSIYKNGFCILSNLVVQDFLGSEDSVDRKALLRKKADWACNINEPRAAAEMYLSAGDTLRAIEIIGANGWTDMLVPFSS